VRIKLDENLPTSLIATLSRLGHDTDSVEIEGLAGARDEAVWVATQEAERFLITQDLDFSDLRRFRPGSHCGILLVRLAVPSRRALATFVESVFRSGQAEQWARCLVVGTDVKIRVRRPPSG
jgi:predicted nuclease of predicted toxin-antitoxin system